MKEITQQPGARPTPVLNMGCIEFPHRTCEGASIGRCRAPGCPSYHPACCLTIAYADVFEDRLGWDSKSPQQIDGAVTAYFTRKGFKMRRDERAYFNQLLRDYRINIAA